MASVAIENVSKVYPGRVVAVDRVSVDIADGEFIVLVGPSGCGKSTLLRMVAGLEAITEGTVRIGDRVVNAMEPANRDIAMVFQNYALYPHMSVRQNMAYGLKNRGVARAEIDRRVAEAAAILQIGDYLDRKPRQLSGGQRQRVAMGRAIVREPACFLFDEPLSNLDAKLRVEMRLEIRQLQRRLATTSIYVTHDQMEAMTLADRLVVLNKGRIEQIGTPLEIYRRPQTTFVAAFIGSPAMNLLEAESDGRSVRIGSARFALKGGRVAAGRLLLGLRAEDAIVLPKPRKGALDLRVLHVEEVGSHRVVHGDHEGHRLTVTLPSGAATGDRLALSVEPDKLHLFASDTGQRIG